MSVLRPSNQRVSTGAWAFLVVAAALLLASLVIATSDSAWLEAAHMNTVRMRLLPRQFQVDEMWRDALPPVVLAGGAVISTLWLPRRRWSLALIWIVLAGVALRYFLWRATTLNTAHPLGLVFSGLMFGNELLFLVIYLPELFSAVLYQPDRRRRQADRLEPWVQENKPSVDVWIPTYNEPLRLVRRAILTCCNLRYSNRTITVLDDGHRPELANLAAELGVNYLSREGNAHRKAGNLNHALAHTSSEFIAVFDCDFMPFAGFLERTLGFFSDPKVALVQTPQHYFQAEFHIRNLGLDVVLPSDIEYFYRYQQVIRDSANAVVCCGTSYVVRRSALEEIGGYVSGFLIEDYQTSTKLLTRGWIIRYLDEVLSMGEVPRTFADSIDQRLRWMQGNMQIYFRPRVLPIWTALNARQKSFYLQHALNQFNPLWRLAYIMLPLLSLVFGFTLIVAPPIEYLAYGVPFVLLIHTLPSWLTGYRHFELWTEVFQTLFCVPQLVRIVQILRHPFRIYGSLVTQKGVSTHEQSLNIALSWPLFAMLAVIGVVLIVRYTLPLLGAGLSGWQPGYEGEGLMLAWNIFNALVILLALLACIDQPVRRATDRFPIRRIGCITQQRQRWWGTTEDLAETGAAFRLQQPQLGITPGTTARLELMEPAISVEAVVERASPSELALRFRSDDASTDAALLGLMYSGEQWFHRPKRLATSDALLHWLGALWRPRPILRRFQ